MIKKIKARHFPEKVTQGTLIADHTLLTDEDVMNKINELVDAYNKITTYLNQQIPTDENGHDFQCGYDCGGTCDCFKNPETREASEKALAQRRKKEKEYRSLKTLKELWQQLGNISVNDSEEIEQPFLHFPIGTDRYTIWHWFEQQNPNFIIGELC